MQTVSVLVRYENTYWLLNSRLHGCIYPSHPQINLAHFLCILLVQTSFHSSFYHRPTTHVWKFIHNVQSTLHASGSYGVGRILPTQFFPCLFFYMISQKPMPLGSVKLDIEMSQESLGNPFTLGSKVKITRHKNVSVGVCTVVSAGFFYFTVLFCL